MVVVGLLAALDVLFQLFVGIARCTFADIMGLDFVVEGMAEKVFWILFVLWVDFYGCQGFEVFACCDLGGFVDNIDTLFMAVSA